MTIIDLHHITFDWGWHEKRGEIIVMVYSEKYIEQALIFEVKKRGGLALKFISPGMSGVPDRLIMMESGKLAFIELKAPGKKLRPLQVRRKRQLEALGFLVHCIDSKEQIGGVLDEIRAT